MSGNKESSEHADLIFNYGEPKQDLELTEKLREISNTRDDISGKEALVVLPMEVLDIFHKVHREKIYTKMKANECLSKEEQSKLSCLTLSVAFLSKRGETYISRKVSRYLMEQLYDLGEGPSFGRTVLTVIQIFLYALCNISRRDELEFDLDLSPTLRTFFTSVTNERIKLLSAYLMVFLCNRDKTRTIARGAMEVVVDHLRGVFDKMEENKTEVYLGFARGEREINEMKRVFNRVEKREEDSNLADEVKGSDDPIYLRPNDPAKKLKKMIEEKGVETSDLNDEAKGRQMGLHRKLEAKEEEDMSGRFREQKSKNKLLEGDIKITKEMCELLKNENERLKNENEEMKNEKKGLRNKNEGLKNENNELKNDLNECHNVYERRMIAINLMKIKIRRSEEAENSLRKLDSAAVTEYEDLKKQFDELKEKYEDWENGHKDNVHNEALESETFVRLKKENEDLRNDCNDYKKIIEKKQGALEKMKNKINEVRKVAVRLNDDAARHAVDIDESKKEANHFKEKYEFAIKLFNDHKKMIGELEEKIYNKERELDREKSNTMNVDKFFRNIDSDKIFRVSQQEGEKMLNRDSSR